METPTITKKQAKSTLSGKKKKTEVIKSVLAKPYANYWPVLNSENTKYLTEILEKFLPRIVPDKIRVLFKTIKDIPKAERRNFREILNAKNSSAISETDRKNLIFGVNDVSKLIENREAASVLVASDVQPRLLVQHILDQAVLHNVPALVVNDLKAICKRKCGVSGAAVALRKTISSDSELGLIQQTICNISENYPVPENHINYHRRADISTITIPDSEDGHSVCVLSDSDEEINVNYHLKRQGKKRAFCVPENANKKTVADVFCLDTCGASPEVTDKVRVEYHSLKVKRVTGDKNRSKKRIEFFKRKKK